MNIAHHRLPRCVTGRGILVGCLLLWVSAGYAHAEENGVLLVPAPVPYQCPNEQSTDMVRVETAYQLYLAVNRAVLNHAEKYRHDHRQRLRISDQMFPGCAFRKRIAGFHRQLASIDRDQGAPDSATRGYLDGRLQVTECRLVLWMTLQEREGRPEAIRLATYSKAGLMRSVVVDLSWDNRHHLAQASLEAVTEAATQLLRRQLGL